MADTLYVASRAKTGGIYAFAFENGRYVQKGFAPMDCPMYQIIDADRMHILLRDPFGNGKSGLVTCNILPDGTLDKPTAPISTEGEIACHLTAFKGHIYCVNYTSGHVTKIGEKAVDRNGPGKLVSHPHYIGPMPDESSLCATDLGQDVICLYDENLNVIQQVGMPLGHGVRHLVFSPDGKFLFTANELSSTVSVLTCETDNLTLLDTVSCLPDDFESPSSAAAIRLYGKDIYVSNRGHNSISRLTFDGKKLRFAESFSCHGKCPRDFIFHEDRIVCANQESHNVTVLDRAGRLLQEIPMEEPICVTIRKEV